MSNFDYDDRARQKVSFEGIVRRGGAKPMDIDMFQEYNGKLFLYFEAKLVGKPLGNAANWAFVNICESYQNDPNRVVWAFVFEHNTPKNEDIIAKDQIIINVVSSIFPEWRSPQSDEVVPKFKLDKNGNLTVLDAFEQIENWCHEHDIKIGKERED